MEAEPGAVASAAIAGGSRNRGIRRNNNGTSSSRFGFILWVVLPVSLAVSLYYLDPFDPAPFPGDKSTPLLPKPQWVSSEILKWANFVGSGELSGPEDLIYEPKLGVIYTGCADGWIMQVKVDGSGVVERLVNTGGRPLGLALSPQNELVVADAVKGLLKVTKEQEVVVLTNEAEGRKFRVTDALDVAGDGVIYFTDASYKYSMHEYAFDSFEGRPYGRLLSFDPATGETKVLLRDLYFANGVALSPDQTELIFCETTMRRCSRYCLKCSDGNASLHRFVVDLPGFPDNIHYDGEGHYWIGITSAFPSFVYKALQSRLARKVAAIIEKHTGLGRYIMGYGGAVAVDLEGKLIAHFYDPGLALITSAIKIGDHLYCGSLECHHIIHVNLAQHFAGLVQDKAN